MSLYRPSDKDLLTIAYSETDQQPETDVQQSIDDARILGLWAVGMTAALEQDGYIERTDPELRKVPHSESKIDKLTFSITHAIKILRRDANKVLPQHVDLLEYALNQSEHGGNFIPFLVNTMAMQVDAPPVLGHQIINTYEVGNGCDNDVQNDTNRLLPLIRRYPFEDSRLATRITASDRRDIDFLRDTISFVADRNMPIAFEVPRN
jgi:hypothetical protein